jgi:hypothetical protein
MAAVSPTSALPTLGGDFPTETMAAAPIPAAPLPAAPEAAPARCGGRALGAALAALLLLGLLGLGGLAARAGLRVEPPLADAQPLAPASASTPAATPPPVAEPQASAAPALPPHPGEPRRSHALRADEADEAVPPLRALIEGLRDCKLACATLIRDGAASLDLEALSPQRQAALRTTVESCRRRCRP